jgi:hypothetical protein
MELDPTSLLPDDPIARTISFVILVLLGWGGRGAIIALREDRRKGASDEVDLLAKIEGLTDKKIDGLVKDLETERTARKALERSVNRLRGRVTQLEVTMTAHQIPVPDWPKLSAEPNDEQL